MLASVLPDVTSDVSTQSPEILRWVGMEDFAVPIAWPFEKAPQIVPAKANVYVSLDKPQVKGIHMSRLYKIVNGLAGQPITKNVLEQSINELILSQKGLSESAKIEISFELILKKTALLSSESGFQSYPVRIIAEKRLQGFACRLLFEIPYSSTCPCSASLARQAQAQAIAEQFSASSIDKSDLINWIQSAAGSIATPHSQRSFAYLDLHLGANELPDLNSLIRDLEATIKTPLQTAVKRIDEQEFAKRNAENLMFCEDAARLIKSALERMPEVVNYNYKIEHQESLHAHNAVVIDQKYPEGK